MFSQLVWGDCPKTSPVGDFTLDPELAEGQYRSLNPEELEIIKTI